MSAWFFIRLKDSFVSSFRAKYIKPTPQQLRDDKIYNAYKSNVRKEIDRLLDKISNHGIKSLTKKEKQFLDENKNI
ncbi:MAG: hypothetical protein LBG19_12345 [Prevotellaceae bacterium]|jgi:hypothetical protein|nr:hypothetical protein [Prevotellaceae bacterium]